MHRRRLRADIRKNLEREVKFRLLARNKQAAMDALVAKAELDLPNASVQAELDRLIENARADLKQRGVKDADKAPIPDDMFRPQAERRVRLGLVVAELVRANSCRPSRSRSRRILTSWPPATKSRPTWCAGT
jgi:trigger factor